MKRRNEYSPERMLASGVVGFKVLINDQYDFDRPESQTQAIIVRGWKTTDSLGIDLCHLKVMQKTILSLRMFQILFSPKSTHRENNIFIPCFFLCSERSRIPAQDPA
jgi:hypothetical protein